MKQSAKLPGFLGFPLRFVPNAVHSTTTAFALNRAMAEPMAEGELEFLRDKVVSIQVRDAFIDLRVTLGPKGFSPVSGKRNFDVAIVGNLYEFLVLATRKEDPDTLFFNRRLRIEGETAVGLQLKNLLDSMEFALPNLPPRMQALIAKSVAFYERLFSRPDKGTAA